MAKIRTVTNQDAHNMPGFYIGEHDKIVSSRAFDAYQGIPRHRSEGNHRGSRDDYKDIDSNTSVRTAFSRGDYEMFRHSESVPKKQKEIIQFCMAAYQRVGIIRNIIDLMGDFAVQGIKIIHPNPRWQKFLRGWFQKINGVDRSERFLNLLYRAGNVAVRRSMMKLTVKDAQEFRAHADTLEVDMKREKDLRPVKKTIPGRYDFLSPMVLEAVGGELGMFTGKQIYGLKVSHKLKQAVLHPKTEMERELLKTVPAEIIRAVKSGNQIVPLDNDKLRVMFYKKDDWQVWSNPMTYAILDDLIMLEKMKLADLAALDGAISQIRLWKLGSLDHELFPTDTAVAKLADILLSNTGGGAFDLIWGPELTLEETSTDVHKFLGTSKYEPVWTSIYQGLGVPPTLTGSATASGFTNNFIAIQTLIRRLEYGRSVITRFWEEELEILRKSLGFEKPAKIVFDRMSLSDEAAEKALLLQLIDRDLVSEETMLERFGEMPELEMMRRKKETAARKSEKLPPKAGPWHAPEKMFDLMKLALSKGLITPGEAGLTEDLGERREGEKTAEENMTEMRKAQIEKANTGQPQQGRPKNSGDSTKRKPKTVKPRTSASIDDAIENTGGFVSHLMWAKSAYQQVSDLVTPVLLKSYGKKTVRSLSSSAFKECEKAKFAILCTLKPFSEIDGVCIGKALTNRLSVPQDATALYGQFLSHIVSKHKREPSVDEERHIRCAVYAILQESE